MKNISLFFIIILSISIKSQTYKFDKLITTELKGKDRVLPISTSQKFIDSENLDYYLILNSKVSAEIFDRSTNLRHFFTILYLQDEEVSFRYVRSCNDSKESNIDYRIKKLNNNEYVLSKYETTRSKNPYFEIKFRIEESNSNQLGLLQEIDNEFIDKFEVYLDEDKSYSIKELNFYVRGKKGKTMELTNTIDLKTEIKLPEKLNIECNN